MAAAPAVPRSATAGNYEESENESLAWRALRTYIRSGMDEPVLEGDTFKLRGQIQKFIFDTDGNYFVEKRGDEGKQKDWYFVKVVAQITDDRLGTHGRTGLLTLPPKKVGVSFFDGRMKDKPRTPIRGGMFNIHYAVTHQEPPASMVRDNGPWDTDDYEGKPIMLNIKYVGKTPEDSAYYGKRANLVVFLDAFERDPKMAKRDDDDDDDAPVTKKRPAVVADDDEEI